MTLPLDFPTFNWFKHDLGDCPSLAGFCDHCIVCGIVVERYSPEGLPFCDDHYTIATREEARE